MPDPAPIRRLAEGEAHDPERAMLVLLGTGTPNADPDRGGPCVAVVVGERAYLVDCGPGLVRRAAAAETLGVASLAPRNLDRVFVTHLHSDHTVGLPDLLLTPWVLGRELPLEIYGPPGTHAMVAHLTAAYRRDIEVRTGGLEPANASGWHARVQEVSIDVSTAIYEDEQVRVTAFPVPHAGWDQAFGFIFDTAERRFVISGDTTPCEAIVTAARDADLLLHEVYSSERVATRPEEWQRYHRQAHTSSRELAQIASRARPALVVLYHQLFWGASEDELVAEIREGYDGPVISGRDLDRFQ